jgi:Fe-S cluster assembly protein SufD
MVATRTASPTRPERFLADLEALEQASLAGPEWLRRRRRAALARLAVTGFPTTRDEAWRQTNVAPVLEAPLRAPGGESPRPALAALDRLRFLGPDGIRLVFVDGRYAPALSAEPPAAAGVRIGSLARAAREDGALAERALEHFPADEGGGFTALNTALFQDGALIHVGPRVALRPPIHLVYVSATPGLVVQPRTVVVAGPGAAVTVLEHYVGAGAAPSWTNAVTDLVAGDGATMGYCRLLEEGTAPYHIAATRVLQGGDSAVRTCAVTLGGALVRQELDVRFGAEGAECRLDGLYLAGDGQHVDHYVRVDHAVPRCKSEQLFKGILDGRARAAFTGHVIVRRDAQKTDATQTNKHLLLADGPEVFTRPWLEIRADDVRCTHGAAEGQLAGDALFYLESRGLAEATARRLLTYGFAREVLERVPVDAIRQHLDGLVRARLGEGSAFSMEKTA